MLPPTPPIVDAAFVLRGSSLPLDHGYLLFAALSRLVPALHERAHWGVHPVFGLRTSPGVLALNERSWLKLRLPSNELGEIMPLAGQSIQVGDHRVSLGLPQLFPLVPSATLKARFVNVKKFHEEPGPFADALRRQLAAVAGLGQDPERIQLIVGDRRVMRIASQTVVGFGVTLGELEASASLAVQRQGLGGRRHMGGGIFVPPGKRG
jgi:CRISPR-associated protein Cas6